MKLWHYRTVNISKISRKIPKPVNVWPVNVSPTTVFERVTKIINQHHYSPGINESLTMIFVVTWITLNLRSDLSSSSSSKNRFAISSPTSARPRRSISLNPINHIRAIFLMSETSPSNETMLPSRYFKKESSLIKSLLKIPGYFKWFISAKILKVTWSVSKHGYWLKQQHFQSLLRNISKPLYLTYSFIQGFPELILYKTSGSYLTRFIRGFPAWNSVPIDRDWAKNNLDLILLSSEYKALQPNGKWFGLYLEHVPKY